MHIFRHLTKIYNDNNTLPALATKNWQHGLRMRVLDILLTWATESGEELIADEEFMEALSDFVQPKPGLSSKTSIIPEEEDIIQKLVALMEKLKADVDSV
eukprot:CAMPEP_0174272438 /NCGR_PEP_ID=MMETSP0439-20130205/51269_1 /TAXON_ID=0 /ORGANISM="Stereomyxa ramosa, Strain Chinc5" /LENGTH=99 /DNA_ID=CAMNT_0015363001 /DNA_START=175 /DNA_END=471 /DNA_ORIENTATION=+